MSSTGSFAEDNEVDEVLEAWIPSQEKKLKDERLLGKRPLKASPPKLIRSSSKGKVYLYDDPKA